MGLTPYDQQSVEPKPRRKWLRRLFYLTLPVLLAGGGTALWSFVSARSEMAKAIAETDALDPGWRLADIEAQRSKVPDAENAALVLKAAETLIVRLPNQFDLENEIFFNDDVYELSQHRLNQQQKAALAALLGQFQKAMPEYLKLANMPRGRFPFPAVPLTAITMPIVTNAGTARQGLFALRFALIDRIEAQDVAGSANNLIALWNATRSFGDEPFLFSMDLQGAMEGVALWGFQRLLAQLVVDAATLARLQSKLESSEARPIILVAARGERATSFEILQDLKSNPKAIPGLPGNAGYRIWLYYLPGAVESQRAAVLRYLNQLVEICRLPPEKLSRALADWSESGKNLPLLARMWSPTMKRRVEKYLEGHARLRCTIAALASERFRLKTGRWPENWEELLAAKLLVAVPIDPFDGQPLKWKPIPEGRAIFSIGRWRNSTDAAFNEMIEKRGYEIGFRLFDPDKRRQPPLPPKPKVVDDAAPTPGEPGPP